MAINGGILDVCSHTSRNTAGSVPDNKVNVAIRWLLKFLVSQCILKLFYTILASSIKCTIALCI